MVEFYYGVVAFIVGNIILGGIRVARGPTRADRMLSGQFLGTSTVVIFLILAEATQQPSLRNLALIFVALAALTTVAFTRAFSSQSANKHD